MEGRGISGYIRLGLGRDGAGCHLFTAQRGLQFYLAAVAVAVAVYFFSG